MKHRFLALVALAISACVSAEFRFERIEDGKFIAMPLEFDSVYGVRDGESVFAEVYFVDRDDSVKVNITIDLGPPATFTSGSYQAKLGGQLSTGSVGCESLTFLGGQGTLPSVGGVFVLKSGEDRPIYRFTMPPTPIQRRLS